MKILIVDDEVIARIGIINSVDWKAAGCTVVGETGDSEYALRMAEYTKPDLVIADIVMPGIDGLEMIRRLKAANPLCRFIILSCMDDVPYYKQAIELGVSGYINKATFRPEELVELLQKVSREIGTDRIIDESYEETDYINRYAVLTTFLNLELRQDNNNPEQIREKLEAFDFEPGNSYRLMAVDLHLPSDPQSEYILRSATVVCSQIINTCRNGFAFNTQDNQLTILLCEDLSKDDMLRNICYRLSNSLQQYFDLTISIGVSPVVQGYTNLRSTFQAARKALEQEFFEKQLFHTAQDGVAPAMSKKIRACRDALLASKAETDADLVVERVYALQDAIRADRYYDAEGCKRLYLSFLYHSFNILCARPDLSGSWDAQIDPGKIAASCKTLDELTATTVDVIRKVDRIIQEGSSANKQLIDRVKDYVAQHLEERLLVEEIAQAVFVSPAYLGRIFKKETDTSLRQYVLDTKITAAKRMLLECRDVAQVAERLNFSSTSHFIKIFKQQVGKTPKQHIMANTRS